MCVCVCARALQLTVFPLKIMVNILIHSKNPAAHPRRSRAYVVCAGCVYMCVRARVRVIQGRHTFIRRLIRRLVNWHSSSKKDGSSPKTHAQRYTARPQVRAWNYPSSTAHTVNESGVVRKIRANSPGGCAFENPTRRESDAVQRI